MKKIILRTAIVFSISIMGILNFNLLVNNGSFSELKLNDLFSQANASCENPSNVYSWSSTILEWAYYTSFYESYNSYSESHGFSGPSGCSCIEFVSRTNCARSWSFCTCNPSKTEGASCS